MLSVSPSSFTPGVSVIRFAALFFLFSLTACSNKPYKVNLMPSPEFYVSQNYYPGEFGQEESEAPKGILYVTSRVPENEIQVHPHYSNEQAHLLRFGTAVLKADDPELTMDELHKISYQEKRDREIVLSLDSVELLGYLPESAHPLFYPNDMISRNDGGDSLFLKELLRQVSRSSKKSVTIFIHGFRVDFSYPILVAKQLSYYTGLDETFLAFSWPSTYRKFSAYMADSETATQSGRDLRVLLEYLARQPEIEQINVIAHSAGTRVAVEACNELALMNYLSSREELLSRYKLNQVVLLSGDASVNRLAGYPNGGILKLCKTLALYQSEEDKALKISENKQKQRRVGQAFSNETPKPSDSLFITALKSLGDRLQVINSTDALHARLGYGHSYFMSSPWVSSDLVMLLGYNRPPSRRGLVYNEEWGTWEFNERYPDLLKEALRK